jgi:hypothetical protein
VGGVRGMGCCEGRHRDSHGRACDALSEDIGQAPGASLTRSTGTKSGSFLTFKLNYRFFYNILLKKLTHFFCIKIMQNIFGI